MIILYFMAMEDISRVTVIKLYFPFPSTGWLILTAQLQKHAWKINLLRLEAENMSFLFCCTDHLYYCHILFTNIIISVIRSWQGWYLFSLKKKKIHPENENTIKTKCCVGGFFRDCFSHRHYCLFIYSYLFCVIQYSNLWNILVV